MDHYAAEAQRMHDGQESAAQDACARAATDAGVTADAAENCDDGECCCPTCPWRATSGKWQATQACQLSATILNPIKD